MMRVSSQAKEASISAVVTRANGKVENLGVIAYHHRNPLRRLWWQFSRRPAVYAGFLGLGLYGLLKGFQALIGG